jgi:hypothetical protein
MQVSMIGGPLDGARTKAPPKAERRWDNARASTVSSRFVGSRRLFRVAIYIWSRVENVWRFAETVEDMPSPEAVRAYMDRKYPRK